MQPQLRYIITELVSFDEKNFSDKKSWVFRLDDGTEHTFQDLEDESFILATTVKDPNKDRLLVFFCKMSSGAVQVLK